MYLNNQQVQTLIDMARTKTRSGLTADLSGLMFNNADCHDIDFSDCDLTGCDFHGANLDHCDFTNSTLDDANFEFAHMKDVTLFRASLTGTNLNGAFLIYSDFTLVNLLNAKWDSITVTGSQNIEESDDFKAIYPDSAGTVVLARSSWLKLLVSQASQSEN